MGAAPKALFVLTLAGLVGVWIYRQRQEAKRTQPRRVTEPKQCELYPERVSRQIRAAQAAVDKAATPGRKADLRRLRGQLSTAAHLLMQGRCSEAERLFLEATDELGDTKDRCSV